MTSAFLPLLELTFGNHIYDNVPEFQGHPGNNAQKHEENIRG
jgi:hypothetical protein